MSRLQADQPKEGAVMEGWVEAVIAEMRVEDLPGVYQEIAKISNVRGAVLISEKWGGLSCYFQQLDALLRNKRDEMIVREYRQGKWATASEAFRTLAIKYKLTEVWIRNIVGRVPSKQEGLL